MIHTLDKVTCNPSRGENTAREELHLIVYKYFSTSPTRGTFTTSDEIRILEICQKTPCLSSEKIMLNHKTAMYPLMCLAYKTESMETLQSFCEQHPEALRIRDEIGNYPLHTACQHLSSLSLKGTTSLLASKYPQAVSRANKSGNLPIHILFSSLLWQGATDMEEDILSLLNIYPDALLFPNRQGHFLCEHALKHNFSLPVFRAFFQRIPENLQSATIYNRVEMTVPKTAVLSKTLPQLKSLKCYEADWTTEAWCLLMKCLESNVSICQLHLGLRDSLATNNTATAAFHTMLLMNNAIKELKLRVDVPRLSARAMTWDLTATVTGILRRNQLRTLSLTNVKLHIPAMAEVLQQNESLQSLALPYHGRNNAELCCLVDVLQGNNTSLQDIYFPCSSLFRYRNEMQIQYYAKLNLFGRRKARDSSTTLKKLVNILSNLQQAKSNNESAKGNHFKKQKIIADDADFLGIYFGLLRELPSTWSITATN